MKHPAGCNEEQAVAYMGCSQSRFEELRKRGIVKPLSRGWYAYDDLDEAMLQLRRERDQSGVTLEMQTGGRKQAMKTPRSFLA